MRHAALIALVLALLATAASADVITLQPTPADLYDLDHNRYYTWGFGPDFGEPDPIVIGATLDFDNIRNWDNGSNWLHVHLLDSAPPGVTTYYDGQRGGDNLAGVGVHLITYQNLTTSRRDIAYTFDADELAALNHYLANDDVAGLGFDPDCHFYNDGVGLTLTYTDEIPEPACVTLIGAGAAVMLVRQRRHMKRQ